MVFTLQRYVFREMFRVFLLATIGLTLIVNFGGILRPVQEYGLGPRQVVHIMTYFMPISLTFVLPVAALFAATLTYGRLAGDNELDACRASGVSVLMLVYPGFMLAVLVAIANLLLSFHVVPRFVRQAEKSLKADAKQIIFHNIQRRGHYDLPPYLIYADSADMANDTLSGIIVVQHEDGRIKRIITSERTQVRFYTHDELNEVQLSVFNARQIGYLRNDLWWEVGSLVLKKEFGSLIEDEIKFKKIEEMKRIDADPMRFDPIARAAHLTYRQLLTELLAREIGRTCGVPGRLYELTGESRSVRVSAQGYVLSQRLTIELQGPIVVEEYDTSTHALLRRMRTNENAMLAIEEGASPIAWALDVPDARLDGTGQLMVHDSIRGLQLPMSIARRLGTDGPLALAMPDRASALLGGEPGPILADFQRALVREVRNARTHIRSEIHSRLALGIGCLPMILIGIGWGILRRGGHVLSAFGASCIPATILGVAILSGKQIAEGTESLVLPGILVMWGGFGFLVVLTALTYSRLLRH